MNAGLRGLLEREGELEIIAAAAERGARGDGALVFIEAAAGMGKSRLLEAGCHEADRRGFELLRSRGGELEQDFAYGVVRQLLERRLMTGSGDERQARHGCSPRPALIRTRWPPTCSWSSRWGSRTWSRLYAAPPSGRSRRGRQTSPSATCAGRWLSLRLGSCGPTCLRSLAPPSGWEWFGGSAAGAAELAERSWGGGRLLAAHGGDAIVVYDRDMDADGLLNSKDPDIDADCLVNERDADSDGDGTPNAADSDPNAGGALGDGDVEIDADCPFEDEGSALDDDDTPSAEDCDMGADVPGSDTGADSPGSDEDDEDEDSADDE